MSKISQVFKELKQKKQKAFIPFITAGYPSISKTEEIFLSLEKAGADIIELGIPFSDPVADGPVIQEASFKALKKGMTLDKAFDLVKRLRNKTDIPIIFMSYYNPIFNMGLKTVVKKANEIGVDGFIIPDLPPESAVEFKEYLDNKNIDLIFLTTINSSKKRTKLVAKQSSGFIYLVSKLGVTGSGSFDLSPVKNKIKEIDSITDTPISVGFGISTPEDAKRVSHVANGVIVGSAFMKILLSDQKSVLKVAKLAKSIKAVL